MAKGEIHGATAGAAGAAGSYVNRRPQAVPATLEGRTPFEWDALRVYLSARAIAGVETVAADGRYWRTVRLGEASGWLAAGSDGDARGRPEIAPEGDPSGRTGVGLDREGEGAEGSRGTEVAVLRLEVSPGLLPVLDPLVARVRRLFDLDTDPHAVATDLARHPRLAPLVARRPGLRLPGTADRFELAVRTVLGQQVTVRGASTLAGRLVRLVAEPFAAAPAGPDGRSVPLTHLPVTAERLAQTRPEILAGIGLPRTRAATLVALARAVADGELPELADDRPVAAPEELVERLTELPGIGRWTATYVAMRALPWRDGFPEGDLGLRKAMGGLTPARLRAAAEAWRPWRAYAAQHLWASLGDSTASPV